MRALLWVGTALAVAVEVWFLVAYGCANYDRVVFPDISWHPDLETFHRSAVALLHGDSIYDTGAKLVNLNPPVWTVVFAPFGLLSPMVAYWVFGAVTTVLFVGCMVAVAREFNALKWPVIVPLLVSSPFMGTFGLGQVYAVLLTGLTGYWLATRRGKHVLAGVCLGLAIALKPTLAPILILPLVQRHWSTLKAAVGGIVGATLVGVVVAGPSATLRWLSVITGEGINTFGDNASLPAFVVRVGGPAWLGFALGVAAIVVTVRRTTNLWALTAATLLLSPIAWHNYLVLVFPGIFLVRRLTTRAFLIAPTLIGVEWGVYLFKGTGLVDHLGQSIYFFVLLSWWIALTVQHDRDDPGQVGEAGDLGGAEHRPARAAHQ